MAGTFRFFGRRALLRGFWDLGCVGFWSCVVLFWGLKGLGFRLHGLGWRFRGLELNKEDSAGSFTGDQVG